MVCDYGICYQCSSAYNILSFEAKSSVFLKFFVACIFMLVQESLETRFANLSSDAMDFMKVCQYS